MTETTETPPSTRDQLAETRKAVVSSSIGAALEWFDLIVYGSFAVVIAAVIFPEGDGGLGLLLTFATFAISYLVRPLGGLVIGAYGDRVGRKKALELTLGLMTIGTLMMAVVPTHEAIGVWAGVIVLLSRIIQGFSAGGEFGSATTYLVEKAPQHKAYYASWQVASQGIAFFLVSSFGYGLYTLLTQEQLYSWGWRIPFAIGILIGPTGLYIRARLSESEEFVRSSQSAKRAVHAAPIRTVVSRYYGRVLAGAALIGVASISAYLMLYLPTFAAMNLHTSPDAAYLGGAIAGLIMAIFAPVIGRVADRVSPSRIMLGAAVAVLVLAWPIFQLMISSPTFATVVVVVVIVGSISTVYFAPLPTLLTAMFPTEVRATGVALSYNIGSTVLGGITPLILAALLQATGVLQIPALYYMAIGALSIIGIVVARRRYGAR